MVLIIAKLLIAGGGLAVLSWLFNRSTKA